MKLAIGVIVLVGSAISAVSVVALKGGKSLSLQHKDAETNRAVSSADAHLPGIFETATFALG